jgi:hypothetical protein
MAAKYVVGLFASKGIAEDACNRLRTEGVPVRDISLMLLRETAPAPASVQTELDALAVDPLVIGNARESFAPYIHNGETAVFVRAQSEADVDLAASTIRQYSPMRIQVAWVEEDAPVGHDLL